MEKDMFEKFRDGELPNQKARKENEKKFYKFATKQGELFF